MEAAAAAVATGDAEALRRVYHVLKEELLRDPSFEFDDDSLQWLHGMLDYNLLGGKLDRGLAVVESYKLLKGGSELSDDEMFLACTLGWCVEWLQAYFLVLDDIMGNSHTRHGRPCWHRLPKVGFVALNDGLVLRTQMSWILRRHFMRKPYYVDLLELFNEVEFQTTSGQLLDQITTNERKRDLKKYTVKVHRHIVQYKTIYYSFYLPVACALLLSGENLDHYVDAKRILVEIGIYSQVQEDYLDCFGDPQHIGKPSYSRFSLKRHYNSSAENLKIGTDIEDFKCSWLFVQALERANESQKSILFENYGKADPACVTKVKALYKELDLERVFCEYERESYGNLMSAIEAQPKEAVQAVLKSFLNKFYKRQM